MIVIDKSRFDAEELAKYEELVAKGAVDPEAAEDKMEEDIPPEVRNPARKNPEEEVGEEMEKKKCKKSAPEMSPDIQKAMDELATLKKSFEMKEMTEVAKKYAPLGKKEDELAQTLYDMKKSNEANYNAYIAILDESLGIVEKSGIFAEIGKSAGNGKPAGGAVAKAEAKAKEIMKSAPDMSYSEAIAKAWEDPDLMAEYDAEYNG